VEAGRSGSPDTEVTAEAQTAKIFEWRQGFNARFLINLDVRLRLFRAFAQSPGARARDIARRLGLHLPYVEIWCTTAYSLGLLETCKPRTLPAVPHRSFAWKCAYRRRSDAGEGKTQTQFGPRKIHCG